MIHRYGPHIFHTHHEDIWNYVRRFAQFGPFINRVKASIPRGVFGLPINLLTINQFFGKQFSRDATSRPPGAVVTVYPFDVTNAPDPTRVTTMTRLRDLSIEDLGGGIHLIDLGASGGVAPQWQAIAHWINVIGFDPNAQECTRLNACATGYRSAKFLPYALAGETGPHLLHKTKSIYCWSLLKPRLEDWLSRFTYAALFEPAGSETIAAYRLDEVRELAGLDLDAMKVDTQGLELPILSAALPFVESCVSIETETGFTQNYEGETTFDQILAFMRDRGFGLFGMNADHAIARKNRLSSFTENEQILWCEAVWLRDYYRSSPQQLKSLTRPKALRALCLYANHGCLAFALEAAALFRDLQLITSAEYDRMAADKSWWQLPGKPTVARKMVRAALNIVPRKQLGGLRQQLSSLLGLVASVSGTPHPLKKQ